MNNKHLPFWILTAAVFVGLLMPGLLRDGMFMDGIQYACVSKNLAQGLGSFWFPYLSATWWKAGSPYFMEHPPLGYFLESFFFKAFGEGMYVERFYSLITAVITGWFIMMIWKLTLKEEPELKSLGWLPIIFWIIIPVCYWSYQNNMLENTMGVFTISSIYFALKGLEEKSRQWMWFVLSAIAIFLATLSKGIPGLFPLCVPIVYRITHRSIPWKRSVVSTLVLILIPIFIYCILLQNRAAHNSLFFYLKERVFQRVAHEHTGNNRFYILYKLLSELLVPLLLCLTTVALFKIKSVSFSNKSDFRNKIFFFLLIGLSGSLPLLLTSVQKGFYLVPSLPYFAIAFSLTIVQLLSQFLLRFNFQRILKRVTFISLLILFLVISFSFLLSGKTARDKDMLRDVYLIGEIVPRDSIIKTNEAIYETWNFQFYLLRYFDISLDPSGSHEFYLLNKTPIKEDLENYKLIPLATIDYDLYRRSK